MAKKATATEKPATEPTETETGLALRTASGELEVYDYGEYAGQGTAYANQGSRIPFLSVLQPLSRACQEGDERYIEGARPGMFLLGDKLYEGKKGVIFIGIEEVHEFVAKTSLDAEGELVGTYGPEHPVVAAARAKYGQKKSEWRDEAGNVLIERFVQYGIVYEDESTIPDGGQAAILAFERTKMSARETIMSQFNKLKANKRPPLFALKVHLTTAFEKGKKGSYHKLVANFAVNNDFVSSLIRPTEPWFADFAAEAVEVAKGVRAGKIKADESSVVDGDTGGEGEGGDVPF